ncbi:MAG: lasso peptide biosynthesis B2 protein [Vicinamibacterales bacterium]
MRIAVHRPRRRLSRQELALAAVVFVVQVNVAVGLRLLRVPLLERVVARCRPLAQLTVRAPEDRVVWAIEAVGRRLTGISTCFVRALAADLLLSRADRPGQVRVGVRRAPRGMIEAHAWFECDGRILVGSDGVAGCDSFVTLGSRVLERV